jgi:NADH-quinone oxidoreductase subunit L
VLPVKNLIVDAEFLFLSSKVMPLFLSFFGVLFAFIIYFLYIKILFIFKQEKNFKIIYNFLNRRWYFDRLYNQFISQKILNFGYKFFYVEVDRGILEQFGPFGLIQLIKVFSKNTRFFHDGSIFHYIFILLIFVFSFFLFFVFIKKIVELCLGN